MNKLYILLFSLVFLYGCLHERAASPPTPTTIPVVTQQATPTRVVTPTTTREVTQTAVTQTTITTTTPTTLVAPSPKTIEITSAGFNPPELTINAGETVVFVNKDTGRHWPASDVHPTHTVYPGSNTNKCGTPEERNIFDACRGLAQGGTYSFTFTQKGSWRYHNHLNPSLGGVIIVR